MKKILLSIALLVGSNSIFSQTTYPCPFTYKSNQGGGGCPKDNPCNGKVSTSITLKYTNVAPPSPPQIDLITDAQGNTYERPEDYLCFTSVFTNATNTEAQVCFYTATGQNSNFFNAQGNLTIQLHYNLPGGGTSTTQTCIIIPDNEEIPTPVHFKSFTANRQTASNVSITWTTASEQNNKGFYVQRNIGGIWKTVAFVPTQALNGTSTSDLTYSYTDMNSEKGITQYRVQQVDLDGKFAYTDIRAIRGEGTVGKVIVYPNPSIDGKVNVVFEDNAEVRDVYVNDMQGKVIKSYKGITNNILVIDRLTSGFYTIKITNRNTAASSVQKVVVK